MRTSLRSKLASITAIAAVALVVVATSSLASSNRVTDRLVAIRSDFLPKITLRPRLESEFDQLRRAFQDAVAAQDTESIDDARRRRDEMTRLLGEAGPALDATRVARLRRELDDYVSAATNLSYRLIAGETGEDLVDAMGAMQERQGRVAGLIDEVTTFRQDELQRSFASALATQRDAARILIGASVTCLVLTMFLSWWLGRGMVRSVGALTAGFQRIGRGDFDRAIEARTHDEFADLASSANAMAKDLSQIAAERERAKWLKEGAVGLADEIRGELSRDDVSKRALRYLVRYANAQLGAVYGVDDGALVLLASHALARDSAEEPSTSFRLGEGILGQAALDAEPTFLDEAPSTALRVRSGFLDGVPPALAFVPLAIDGRAVGVLELAAVSAFPARTKDFLQSVAETVAIALEVARSRGATRELLVATQTLAQRLVAQEEELRATNEELEVQQEALRERNDELVQQAGELESQRQVVEAKNTELESARATLQQKAEELATMSAYKSQFLANMSHELRTPLNSMLLLSSLLAENSTGNLTPKQVEHSRTIHAAGTDLLALINQVLDLSKIEAGKTEVHLEPVGLASIATQLRRMFEHVAQDKGLAFEVVVDASLPADIMTDRHRILQILTNLVGNAIKFTARGEVRVEVLPAAASTAFRRQDLDAASTVAFIVSDTGPGIPAEHCNRIFEPFEQVGGAKERRSGTGLGLAIARELAALLGGEIGVSSEVGKGSRFVLHIPIGTQTDAETIVSAAVPSLAPMTTALRMLPAKGGPPTILLIEDDPTFASVFSDLVIAQGLRCIVAGDGATGVRLARDARPAGIVLDLGLPDIDGFAVLERLRADSVTASIPVHIVSGADGAERAKKLGAVGYLRKPAAKDDLVRSIEALVPGRPDRPLRVLVVEDDVTIGESLVAMLAVDRIDARRVGTAEAALEALASDEFRCAIVDLSLPDMDGLDLLRTLEERDGVNRPPVIVYTGRPLSKAETQAIERYAEAVVLKEGASIARVLDEVRLFTRTLRKRGPSDSLQRPPSVVEAKLAGRKLLLVDDDMRTVYALSAMLRSRGADVVVADTGRAALSALDEHPDVDAVLMDIMMPEMDGYEAMRRIRELPRFRSLPIIALTAKAMLGDEAKCLEAGASAYLSKPIDSNRLFGTLAAYFDGAAA